MFHCCDTVLQDDATARAIYLQRKALSDHFVGGYVHPRYQYRRGCEDKILPPTLPHPKIKTDSPNPSPTHYTNKSGEAEVKLNFKK